VVFELEREESVFELVRREHPLSHSIAFDLIEKNIRKNKK